MLAYRLIHHSDKIKQLDQKKRIFCESYGITLLVVPYWWNHKADSIAGTLHLARPDLPIDRSMLGTPISTMVPKKTRQSTIVVRKADFIVVPYYPQKMVESPSGLEATGG